MQPGMTPTVRAEMTSAKQQPANADLDKAILTEIQQQLGDQRFGLWCDGKIGLAIADDQLTVSVSSPFLLNWMQKQFRKEMTTAAQHVLGHSAHVVFTVDPAAVSHQSNSSLRAATSSAMLSVANERAARSVATENTGRHASHPTRANGVKPGAAIQTPQSGHSSPATTNNGFASPRGRRLADLNDFVTGPQTELAFTAAKQVASGKPVPFNPLYICGPVGSGKTHLLEGICRHLKRTMPAANVLLITAEAFANYFTQAIRDNSLPSFRQRFRGVDVLIVDNVEFFESKRAFQEEFLHTFAELVDHGRMVVLSGTRHPRLLTKLSDELVSRFQSGLICRLEIPDFVTRLKIVEAKAAQLSADLARDALEYIAQRFQGSVRELEGALNSLHAYFTLTRKRITQSTAREVLADLERDCLRLIRLADVERVVCNLFGIRPKDLQSESRVRTISQPRMLAMFLARKLTPSAYTEIGQHFGGRNHSTVMSAERKVQQWLEHNEPIRIASQTWSINEIVQTLEQQLLAG